MTPTVVIRGTRKGYGWEARQIVRDGLADVIAWLREHAAAPSPLPPNRTERPVTGSTSPSDQETADLVARMRYDAAANGDYQGAADLDVLILPDPDAHPWWCKCQRVCGGDQ